MMNSVETICDDLLCLIRESGAIPIQLPSEKQLMDKYGVTYRTARGALQRLVREGYATAEKGRGYFSRVPVDGETANRLRVGIVYDPTGADGAVDRRAEELQLGSLVASIEEVGMQVELLQTPPQQTTAVIRRKIRNALADVYVLVSLPPMQQAFFATFGARVLSWGGTYDDLGMPSVALNRLEIARAATERLFAAGHRRVCLLQDRSCDVADDDTRMGFEYAHHLFHVRFKSERLIRINRQKEGLSRPMKRLFLLAPTGILVSHATLLERIWSHADDAGRKMLAGMEAIVLSPDSSRLLRHPAMVAEVDLGTLVPTIMQVLMGILNGCPLTKRHHEIPWKFTKRP